MSESQMFLVKHDAPEGSSAQEIQPLTLKQYAKEIAKLIKERPELADIPCVYSRDEEGNGFDPVYFGPTPGNYHDGGFTTGPDDDSDVPIVINAICIN